MILMLAEEAGMVVGMVVDEAVALIDLAAAEGLEVDIVDITVTVMVTVMGLEYFLEDMADMADMADMITVRGIMDMETLSVA